MEKGFAPSRVEKETRKFIKERLEKQSKENKEMKYWRIEKEETVTYVAHVIAETKEDAIIAAKYKYERYDSSMSRPDASEVSKAEYNDAKNDE